MQQAVVLVVLQAVFSSNTTSRSAGGATGSSAGTPGKSVGGTTSIKTDGAKANMAGKEDPAPQESERAATVKKRVHDWRLTRPAKARAEIWTRGWFKIYGGKRVPDRAVCTLCVRQGAW